MSGPHGIRPLLVRREAPGDIAASSRIHALAFPTPAGATVPVEVGLLERLRTSCAWLPRLSLVATTAAGQVVGHVICTRAHVADHESLGLGPIAVLPELQGRGVGTALMHAVLGAAEACDEPLVGVLGEPRYYARFGFARADLLDVEAPDPGWGEYFQIRTLAAYTPSMRGRFRYAPPFGEL